MVMFMNIWGYSDTGQCSRHTRSVYSRSAYMAKGPPLNEHVWSRLILTVTLIDTTEKHLISAKLIQSNINSHFNKYLLYNSVDSVLTR